MGSKEEIIRGKPTYGLVEGIFDPSEGNIVIDYPRALVLNAMKGDIRARFRNLEERGRFNEEEMEKVKAILSSIND